ncbi:MAG TPA: hypothetical protein VL307_04905 [Chitinophagaceae bacterium]|nr:hypothetical protein [Chitinophagaceae bacterium]
MESYQQPLSDLQDIKRIMERSSRFISLSGLSGIAAGIFGLVGAALAYQWINDYYTLYNTRGKWDLHDFANLEWRLFLLGIAVLSLALLAGFYFTWKKAKKNNTVIWNASSRRLLINLCIPLLAGGVFVLALLQQNDWKYIGPACLLFYGLALINGSKYTLDEVRYLGMLEITLGCINLFLPGYGLYFWAAGFGILHIIYGLLMWNKYERTATA